MLRSCALRVLLVLLALGLSACAGFVEIKGVDYPDSARLNFEEGLRYLQAENYDTAQQYFQLVKNKYSFSMYAKAAELLIADTYFKRDMHAEAIAGYKVFQRNHPKHECVPYAQYRLGEVYYDQVAEDWWFMPPAFEKDQDYTEKALFELRQFIRMERAEGYYFEPGFKPMPIRTCLGEHYQQKRAMIYRARRFAEACMDRLVNRELYVAQYYLKRKQPTGAVLRLEGLFQKYPEYAANKELVRLLARAYEEAHMYKKARAAQAWIAEAWPQDLPPEALSRKTLELLVKWARYYESVQRYEQARIAWRYIAGEHPDSPEAARLAEHDRRVLGAWAEHEVGLRRFDNARTLWQTLKREHPDSREAARADAAQIDLLQREARFWREQNFFGRAVRALEALRTDYPESPQAAQVESELARVRKAEQEYLAIPEDTRPQSVWQLIELEGRQRLEPDPDPNSAGDLPLPPPEEVFPGY